MKISPFLPVAPTARPAATPTGAPGVPFETFLAASGGEPAMDDAAQDGLAQDIATPVIDLARVQDHRALGFSEASLLGQGQDPVAAPADDPDPVAIIDPASAAGMSGVETWLRPNLPSLAPAAVSGSAASPLIAAAGRTAPAVWTPAAQPLGRTSAHAVIVRAIGDALHDALAQDPVTPDRERGAARFDPARPSKPPSKTQVAVSVSEAGGALQVIAASPGLHPEAAARVRRIVADMVERFGLRLSDLHLNGVRVAPPSTGPTGAAHGG